jgi:4-hydroxy-tetrahydrodipicolinate synthase
MSAHFRGSYAALPTPFREDRLDLASLEAHVEGLIVRGSDGLVACGTTGEAATLTAEERDEVLRATVQATDGRVPVIAGIGTNCTRTSVELAVRARRSGVDGLLAVTPYYNRPAHEGLKRHFLALARATELPLILYNVPSRTGVDLTPELAAEIAGQDTRFVGIKEASGEIERAHRLAELTDLDVLCGEDKQIAAFMRGGAAGAIGVVANLVPEKVAELVRVAAPGGNRLRAETLEGELSLLVRTLFLETNPIPLKAALALLGRCPNELRLPLSPLSDDHRPVLEQALAGLRVAPDHGRVGAR